jgi:hypothetical protein
LDFEEHVEISSCSEQDHPTAQGELGLFPLSVAECAADAYMMETCILRAKATVGLHASTMHQWPETVGIHRHFGTSLPSWSSAGKPSDLSHPFSQKQEVLTMSKSQHVTMAKNQCYAFRGGQHPIIMVPMAS